MRVPYATFIAAIISFATIVPANAQVQRSFINLGFEQPALDPNAADCPQAFWPYSTVMPENDVPGWRTTHPSQLGWCTNNGDTTGFTNQVSPAPLIDIWKTEKVVGIASRSGVQHAELNALEASRIYQTVCLLQNDSIAWRFSHRARGDVTGAGTGLDKMRFKISADNGTDIETIAEAESDAEGNGLLSACTTLPASICNPAQSYTVPGGPSALARRWVDYSGSFTWSQPSANYQFGFEALSSANLGLHEGNLIDDIQLDGLRPFAELSSSAYSSQEGSVDDVAILFSGLVTGAPLTVQIEVTAGSAVLGDDFIAPAVINVVIPPNPNGYRSEKFSFQDQIQILGDTLEEGPETFSLRVLPSSDFLIENTRTCSAPDINEEAIYTILDAHISLTKTGTPVDLNGNGKTDAGDRIDYTLRVTNTGGVDLTDVQVNDPLLGGNLVTPPANLAAGAFIDVTGSYMIISSDMVAGQVSNTATATANSPTGAVPSKNANHVVTLDVEPDLDFIKAARDPAYIDANSNGQIDAGEQVPFDFTITNTGNVDATIVAVADDLVGFQFQGLTLPHTLPAVPAGQQITFTGVHLVTQAEIDAGEIINGADAFYTAAGQNLSARSHAPTGAAQTRITIPEPPANSILTLTKEITATDFGADGLADAGETISYRIVVLNNSSLTVQNLTVSDLTLGLSQNVPQLGPWQSQEIAALVYILSQADIDAGTITNTATATASTMRGTSLSASASIDYPLDAIPSVDLLKEATFVNLVGTDLPEAGDRVDYTFTVTNTGNVSIASYTITDPQTVVEKTREAPPLLPGQSDNITFKASRIITQDDVNAGRLENIATLNGLTTGNVPVSATSHGPDGQPTVIQFAQNAAIEVQLTGTWLDANGNGVADVGERVEYHASISNTGNVLLINVALDGILPQGAPAGSQSITLPVSDTIATLAPGSTHNVSYYYILTQADIDLGTLASQLKAVGQGPDTLAPEVRFPGSLSDDPNAGAVIDTDGDGRPDRPALVVLPQLIRLSVEKSGSFPDAQIAGEGTRIEYTISITNTGNVTLLDVAPVDPGPLFSNMQGTGTFSAFVPDKVDLAPGAPPAIFTAIYTMSLGDVDKTLGTVDAIVNVAGATGRTANGAAPEVIPGEAKLTLPGVLVSKRAGISEALRGMQIPYTITLESRSISVPVTVRMVDSMPAGFSYAPGTATVAGTRIDPKLEGQALIFDDIIVPPDQKIDVQLALLAGPSVKHGTHVNRAQLYYPDSWTPLSRESTAAVEITIEAYLDCGDVIGTVFNDKNRNGYQDKGDAGLPGARVVTAQGMIFKTDEHGRFSVACADLPDGRIGSTYIMKLDPRSMPSGYRILSENPRTIRLTAGKVSRVNFATSIARVVRIDIADAAFLPGQTELRPEWQAKILQLVEILKTEHSVLRISYSTMDTERGHASRRIKHVRQAIESRWKETGNRYNLEIEARVVTANSR